ncbi:MAG: carboxypeptidase regulatory-like domain-containing protein [Candidatus Hodarchaeota archaeon]
MKTKTRQLVIWSAVAFLCGCFLSAEVTVGAEPAIQWENTFGGNSDDTSSAVQQTSDGGYIIAGTTESYSTWGSDVYLIKTDAGGNKVWQQCFNKSEEDDGWSVQQTSDGGYIIAGRAYLGGEKGHDVYLIKTNSSGSKQWESTFGGNSYDYGYSVQQTSDGGYIIAGVTNSYGAGFTDVYIVKTNSSGEMQWQRTFGGGSSDYGKSVELTSDGGYIIAGQTGSFGAGGPDAYLVKIDSSGNMQWQETFGGSMYDTANSVQQTSDGGYILTGWTSYPGGDWNVYLVKTNSVGTMQWEKRFGGSNHDYGHSVQQTSDGGYIIAGSTWSFGAEYGDVYLLKTDGSGVKQWDKLIGGSSWESNGVVQQTSDGGYIIAANTRSGGPGNWQPWDVYLIKIGSSQQLPEVTIKGTVYDIVVDKPLAGVIVQAEGKSKETACDGKYEINGLSPGEIVLTASKPGYQTETQTVAFAEPDHTYIVDFQLAAEASVIDSGFYPSQHGFHFPNWGIDLIVREKPIYGHCVGMTYASNNYYLLGIEPIPNTSLPPRNNPQRIYISWLQAKYLVSTAFQSAFELIFELPFLNSAYVEAQYSIIRTLLENGKPCPILLASMEPLGGKAGHAVLAYKIIEIPLVNGILYHIYIYDNVYPDDCNRYIQVQDWSGNWSMLSYGSYSRFTTIETSGLSLALDLTLAYVLHSPGTIQIIDPNGFVLDTLNSGIEGGHYRVLDFDGDGDEEELAIILWPKEGSYSVNVIPDSDAEPDETYTLEEYKFGKKTVLAENVEIQNIPSEPYVSIILIPATIDIEPDALNIQSEGQYVTVFIELPAGYSPVEIDSTVIDIHMPDLYIFAEPSPRDIGDYDLDGISDLMVKFDRQLFKEVIGNIVNTSFQITVAGYLTDGTRFEGTDTIIVID